MNQIIQFYLKKKKKKKKDNNNNEKYMYMLWFNFPWFKFYFPLFWGMVMYDDEF